MTNDLKQEVDAFLGEFVKLMLSTVWCNNKSSFIGSLPNWPIHLFPNRKIAFCYAYAAHFTIGLSFFGDDVFRDDHWRGQLAIINYELPSTYNHLCFIFVFNCHKNKLNHDQDSNFSVFVVFYRVLDHFYPFPINPMSNWHQS